MIKFDFTVRKHSLTYWRLTSPTFMKCSLGVYLNNWALKNKGKRAMWKLICVNATVNAICSSFHGKWSRGPVVHHPWVLKMNTRAYGERAIKRAKSSGKALIQGPVHERGKFRAEVSLRNNMADGSSRLNFSNDIGGSFWRLLRRSRWDNRNY